MDQRPPDSPWPDEADDFEGRLDDFENAWRAGPPPALEDFLPPAADRELLEELIKIDLEYRWRRVGQDAEELSADRNGVTPPADPLPPCPRLEDYARRYPELGPPEQLPLILIGEEYRVRQRWGDRPGYAEYLERFPSRSAGLRPMLDGIDAELAAEAERARPAAGPGPSAPIRCPHCRQTIDVAAELLPRNMACPSCGGAFGVETFSTGGRLAARPPVPQVGRYQLRTLLGTGAFGSVWRAWDTELAREVAVKLPRSGQFPTRAEEERFLREARSTAQLHHPGIVAIHDVGRDQNTVYIVSDLVRGRSLEQWLRTGPLGFREAAELVMRVAEALDCAHRQGVIHRDVKPANILLEGLGTRDQGLEGGKNAPSAADRSSLVPNPQSLIPKLTDFGLAKRDAGELTMTLDGQVLGTPAYMSPEQVRDPHAVDGRSDVYSLGVILYQLLTGELPFRGSARMLLLQVICDEPRPPRQLNEQVPRDLETVCLKCLQKEPARRYRTAGALAADLRRWLANEPIEARPAGHVERLWRWLRRHPALALTGGLGTAAVVALLGAPAVVALVVLAAAAGYYALYQTRQAGELAQALRQLGQDQQRTAAALEMALKQCYVVRQERDRAADAAADARRRFEPARELARTLIFDFHDRLAELPGSAGVRVLLVRMALTYLDRLRAEAGHDPNLLRELAAAYTKVGDAQGHPQQPNVGNPAGALASYRQSAELFEALAQTDLAQAHRDLAVASHKLGLVAAQLAADARPNEVECLQWWTEARTRQQRALELMRSLQQRGALADADAGVPDLLAVEVARCDAAVARLKHAEPVAQPVLNE